MPETEHCCKVGRIADKYGISPGVSDETLDVQLEKRWIGTDEYPETSLRSLVDWVHKHMMRTVYIESGRSTLEPHLESDYRVLKDDENENQHAVLADLEQDGIDGEELLSDFISASTLYRHFTQCLDVTKERKRQRGSESADRSKLAFVQDNAEMYISDLLKAWENRGAVPHATEAEIAVRVYLECPVCSKQANIQTVHRRGYVCKEHMSANAEAAGRGSDS